VKESFDVGQELHERPEVGGAGDLAFARETFREIAEVLRDLSLLKGDKDLSFGERRLLDQAKSLLMKELALAKKITLRGEDVWLRFFDSRLYERQELTSSKLRSPYLLCFRSERGRNTTRVFTELDKELSRLMRENPKELMVTFITHGRCQIDIRVLESLKAIFPGDKTCMPAGAPRHGPVFASTARF